MNKYKIVFKDGDFEKLIFGWPEITDNDPLIKVKTDRGNVFYIQKSSIIFMKELKEGF